MKDAENIMGKDELRENIIDRLKKLNDLEPLANLFENMQGEDAVLSYIFEKEKTTPSEISMALDFSKARSTAILKSLEKKTLVKITKVKEDKRKHLATLTEEGIARVEKTATQATAFFDDYLSELGESEGKKLIKLLDKSIHIAKKHHGIEK